MPKRKADAALKKKGEEQAEDEAKKQTAGGGDEDDSEDDDDYEGEGGSEEGGSDDSDGDSDEDDEGEEDESSGSGDSEDSFPSASSDEAESEDDEDGEAYKEIDCAFEFFDPQERDFHGLRALLGTYLDGATFDLSGLCESVIGQTAVGTVVKSAEDDDPFAVLTAFNTARGAAAGATWLAELKAYLTSSCPEPALKEKLEKAWSGPGTGLLVSERLINCPPQLAPPLLHFLMEEIEGAATDPDYPEAERSEFAFARYLHFTRVYSDPQEEEEEEEEEGDEEGKGAGPGPSGSMGPPPPKKPKTVAGGSGGGAAAGAGGSKGKAQQQPVIVYVRPEDEYLHQVCSWSYTFPVTSRPVAKGDLRPLRCVMCVEAGRVAEARAMMDLVVGNPMEGAAAAGGGGGAAAAAGPKQGQGQQGKKQEAAVGGRQGQGQAATAAGNKGPAAAGQAGAKGKGKTAGGKAGGSGR